MKKIFLIAVVLLVMINFIINYHHEVAILLNHRFDTANQGIERFTGIRFLGPKSITNLLFGELMMRIVKYPCFFQQEDTSVSGYQGYARFSFTNHANIILESYVCPEFVKFSF